MRLFFFSNRMCFMCCQMLLKFLVVIKDLIFLPLAYLYSIDHWIVSIIYQHSESSGIYVFIFLD